MLFAELAATSVAVTAVSGRRAKVELLATALTHLATDGDEREIEAGAAYLAGEMRQRQIGVGWASLRDLPPPAEVATLTVAAVDAPAGRVGRRVRQRIAGAPAQPRPRPVRAP